jgi:hypothetical protein
MILRPVANLGRPVGIPILRKGFPIEFHYVASGKREIARHYQMTEMGPASARGVLRVDDSPSVFVIPETDNSVGLHRVSLGALRGSANGLAQAMMEQLSLFTCETDN